MSNLSKPISAPLNYPILTRLRSRALLIAIMLIAPLAGLFLYAGSAWPAVTFRLIFDGGTAFLWLIACVGFGTFILAKARSG